MLVLEPDDRNRALVGETGGLVALDLATLGADADIVFSMIPNDAVLKRVALDGLGLDETTAVPAIAGRRRFRCQVSGPRHVRVSPDWTDHRLQGNGREMH